MCCEVVQGFSSALSSMGCRPTRIVVEVVMMVHYANVSVHMTLGVGCVIVVSQPCVRGTLGLVP